MTSEINTITLRWVRQNPPIDSTVYHNTQALVRVVNLDKEFGWDFFVATLQYTEAGWQLTKGSTVWACERVDWAWLG